MALPHAQSGQIVSMRPLGDRLPETVTTAILKAGQLEVIRVVLPVGKSMKEHQTPGEGTVFDLYFRAAALQAGEVMAAAMPGWCSRSARNSSTPFVPGME